MIFLASCEPQNVRHDLHKPDIVVDATDAQILQALTEFYREQGWEMIHKNTGTGKVSHGQTVTQHHFEGSTSDGVSAMVLVANRTNRQAEIKISLHPSAKAQQLAAIKRIESLLKEDEQQLNPN